MAQPDLHPDADLLNAFVERALPEAERARVVAHMAGCGRCRDVVFLAQAAAQPEIAPATVAEPRPGWFSTAFTKWRIALIPAAALVVVAGVVLWVQLHPGMQPTEMAKLASPTAPGSPQAAPAQSGARQAQPTAREIEEAGIADSGQSLASSRRNGRAPTSLQKKAPPEDIGAIDQLAHSDAPQAPALPQPPGQIRAADGIHLDARSAAAARYPVPPPPALGSASAATFAAAGASPPPMNVSRQAAMTVDSAAASRAPAAAPAPPNIVAMHGTVMASGGPAQTAAAPPSSKFELAPQPMNGPAVMRLAMPTKLPSGLNTVSSAALLNRLVAVDSGGVVFQSQDGGKRWDAVFPRWTGKAVQVQAPSRALFTLTSATETQAPELTSVPASVPVPAAPAERPAAPPSAGSNAAPSAAKAKAAPPVLPLQFKLMTDRHEVWVSADGKLWRRQ